MKIVRIKMSVEDIDYLLRNVEKVIRIMDEDNDIMYYISKEVDGESNVAKNWGKNG